MKQQSEGRAVNALSALEPFARAWAAPRPTRNAAASARGRSTKSRHEHLVDLESRALLCACPTCGTTFAQPGAGGRKLRLVPTRVAVDPGFRLDDAQWDGAGDPGPPRVHLLQLAPRPLGGALPEPGRRRGGRPTARRARSAGRRHPPDRGD